VRNLRVAGTGALRVGQLTEAFRGRGLTDEEKAPVLRDYLQRWKVKVGAFFDGVGPDSSDAEIPRSPPSTRGSKSYRSTERRDTRDSSVHPCLPPARSGGLARSHAVAPHESIPKVREVI
jgi:hypothetical protein